MRKDIRIMTSSSRRTYTRPLITAVIPASLVLQEASPTPEVHVDPGQDGYEALSKEYKIEFDIWREEEEEETPTKPFKFDWRKISTH